MQISKPRWGRRVEAPEEFDLRSERILELRRVRGEGAEVATAGERHELLPGIRRQGPQDAPRAAERAGLVVRSAEQQRRDVDARHLQLFVRPRGGSRVDGQTALWMIRCRLSRSLCVQPNGVVNVHCSACLDI